MTREEAIQQLESLRAHCDAMCDDKWTSEDIWDKDVVALVLAISAIRTISHERVEKVCLDARSVMVPGVYGKYAENLTKTLLAKYCPHCGRPLTDEAVQMMIDRIEALKNGE